MSKYLKMLQHSHYEFSVNADSSEEIESSDDPEHPPASEEIIRGIVNTVQEKVEGGTRRVYLTDRDLYLGKMRVTISSHHENDHSERKRLASVTLHSSVESATVYTGEAVPQILNYVVFDDHSLFRYEYHDDNDIYTPVSEDEALRLMDLIVLAKPHLRDMLY